MAFMKQEKRGQKKGMTTATKLEGNAPINIGDWHKLAGKIGAEAHGWCKFAFLDDVGVLKAKASSSGDNSDKKMDAQYMFLQTQLVILQKTTKTVQTMCNTKNNE